MCWSHMGRKCDDRLARISDKEISANMRAYWYLGLKVLLFGGKLKFLGGKNHLFLG